MEWMEVLYAFAMLFTLSLGMLVIYAGRRLKDKGQSALVRWFVYFIGASIFIVSSGLLAPKRYKMLMPGKEPGKIFLCPFPKGRNQPLDYDSVYHSCMWVSLPSLCAGIAIWAALVFSIWYYIKNNKSSVY